MATTTWAFSLWNFDPQTRELIDLPTDFYLKVTFTHTMPKEVPKAIVTMNLERVNEPKTETHILWEGAPPYYGYGKKVAIKVVRDPKNDPPHNPLTGSVEIVFQANPF